MIKIDETLFNTYQPIQLGCIEFTCTIEKENEEFWKDMHETIIPSVQEKIAGKEWNQIDGVKGSRLAYKAFGRNPGRYRVSSESLLRRIKRNDELYHINSIVDINNYISIQSGFSVGSYDLDKIQGDILFRKATNNEGYTGIGKDFLDMENMLVLVDEQGLFGSSMSDSTRCMVKDETKHVLVVIYCFEKSDLESLLEFSVQAFKKYGNVENISSYIK